MERIDFGRNFASRDSSRFYVGKPLGIMWSRRGGSKNSCGWFWGRGLTLQSRKGFLKNAIIIKKDNVFRIKNRDAKNSFLNLKRLFPSEKIMKYWKARWIWRQLIYGKEEIIHTYVRNWRVYPFNHLEKDCQWNYIIRLIYFILLPAFN